MNGYNDKMTVLVQHVLEKIKGLVVRPDRLAVMKEQVSLIANFTLTFIIDNVFDRRREIGTTFSLGSLIAFRIILGGISYLHNNGLSKRN